MKVKSIVQNKKERLETIFQENFDPTTNKFSDIEFLVNIVNVFRPNNIKIVYDIDVTPLLTVLSENQVYKRAFSDYLKELFYKKDFDQIITDAGIIKDSSFFYEIKKRLIEKILPEQHPKSTLQYVLSQVFYASTDPIWLNRIPKWQIDKLLDELGFSSIYSNGNQGFEMSEIIYALEVIMQRVSGKAMESEVNKMVPEFQNFDSPFIAIHREFAELNSSLMLSDKKYTTSDNLNYKQILILHKQCRKYVKTALKNAHKFGISLKVNQSLLRIRQQLDRIEEMLPFLILDSENSSKQKSIDFIFLLIKYNCDKSNIRKLINKSTQILSYEITHHTALTGEHYITNNRKEYFKMLRSASLGGIIVAFLCIFKLLLSKIETSDFGHAFYYSMNYSFGFIAIYLLGATLATKQPAMTASALINSLEQGSKDKTTDTTDRYRSFAVFFARVFRSQFIAFVGNVLLAFPVALGLIWLIDIVFHYNIADQKWHTLINDLSPIDSPAIFHAAIAGFFLFISGIIAGSVSNRDKHNHVYYKIQEHPILKKTFGKEKTRKIAAIYEKKWAGIISNFWFGVFLGSTASIGLFLGLNLDIRHITFASGNLALGIYGGDFDIPLSMMIWGIIGVGVIGLVNFLVSFILSLVLAFRSRDISLLELRGVAYSIWRFFKLKPLHFFFPPRKTN
jgi:site-specific recombinase